MRKGTIFKSFDRERVIFRGMALGFIRITRSEAWEDTGFKRGQYWRFLAKSGLQLNRTRVIARFFATILRNSLIEKGIVTKHTKK